MFVRTHVAFYFVSLLLSDILQGESLFIYTLAVYLHRFVAISSIMNAAWVSEGAVVYGSLCTVQGRHGDIFALNSPTRSLGVLRHTSDVGIAIW